MEFPPALDEFFGITNNKQEATNFSVMTKKYGVEMQDKPADVEELNEEDKINVRLSSQKIQMRIRNMRTQIEKQESVVGRQGSRNKDTRIQFSDKVKQREDDRDIPV